MPETTRSRIISRSSSATEMSLIGSQSQVFSCVAAPGPPVANPYKSKGLLREHPRRLKPDKPDNW
jgi:hypothetical protein